MPKNLIRAVVAGAASALLAMALNPSADAHRTKIKAELAARSPLAGLLRLGNVAAFASVYHSVGVASYTTLNGRWVSVGAFGGVWVADLAARR
jgi:hypothetical protein